MNKADKPLDASEVIDGFGGTAETARICEVSPAAVSQWRLNGIPKPQMRYLRLMRPEIFGLPSKSRRKTDKSGP